MKRVAALAVFVAIASCDDVSVHILSGQLYDPQNACLESSTGIDVVQGGSTGDNCSPQCISVAVGDATSTYVTTTCPPFPGDYTVEGEDATTGSNDPCTSALAAYESGDAACPATETEGGPDDGSTDSGDDGAADDAASISDAGPGEAGDDASDSGATE
ncbi:MAG: hypothetical protein ACRELB_04575 [Polyangiaceae bacterium]